MPIILTRRGHPITTGLLCPCCGQPTRRQWEQPALLPHHTPLTQTDCTNEQCVAFYATLSPAQFESRFNVTLEENAS